ncbi:MAG: nitrilase [Deltaproteobacteria bacterium]|nr:nitrilase [Deltaproteobacteria bacterium]MBW2193738.1 nitrilase [Deltaproteobacteria bacterium]
MKDIRIAAVVFNSTVGNISSNLERMARRIKAAAAEGASLVCFPELNVTGYTTHRDIKKAALQIPGPITRKLSHLAASENIVIMAGLAEKGKASENHDIFASHLVVKPEGDLGVYRKLHIAPPETSVFKPGNGIPLFEACGLKFGIQLCYDAHFPELTTHMALMGADLIFMPHASPRGTAQEKHRSWMRHMPARAYDNGLFIVACNQVGENGKGLRFPGNAVVIGPSGEVIDTALNGREEMMVIDLKAEDLDRVRNHRMRYFLPNRRPELYSLNLA